jgi:phospholipid transport system substrate-binding protein
MLKTVKNMTPQLVLSAICAGLILTATSAHADDAAEIFVQGILDEAEPILSLEEEGLFEGVAVLVDKYVDMRRVGLFALGQYARVITDEQKEEYIPLFKEYATQIYQHTLSNYAGQKLAVVNSVDRSDRDIIVNSKIVDPEPGDPLTNAIFHWRVYRNRNGEMSVVDAGADNVWLAIEQRSQFTSIIANNGGGETGMDALLADLRRQVGE